MKTARELALLCTEYGIEIRDRRVKFVDTLGSYSGIKTHFHVDIPHGTGTLHIVDKQIRMLVDKQDIEKFILSLLYLYAVKKESGK